MEQQTCIEALRGCVRGLGHRTGAEVYFETLRTFARYGAHTLSAATVIREVGYGKDERQRLTVFHPEAVQSALPVLLFLHGGGFVQGATQIADSPFFDNIGHFAVANGMVGVNMTYRLAPDHRWPSIVEDLRAAISWIHDNIADFSGDRSRIVAMGSSAGASGIVSLLGQCSAGEVPLAAIILRSGVYDINSLPALPVKNALESYFTPRGGTRKELLDPGMLQGLSIPAMVTVGEFDPPEMRHQAVLAAIAMLEEPRSTVRVQVLPNQNHFSVDFAMGSADSSVDDLISSFLGETGVFSTRRPPCHGDR